MDLEAARACQLKLRAPVDVNGIESRRGTSSKRNFPLGPVLHNVRRRTSPVEEDA